MRFSPAIAGCYFAMMIPSGASCPRVGDCTPSTLGSPAFSGFGLECGVRFQRSTTYRLSRTVKSGAKCLVKSMSISLFSNHCCSSDSWGSLRTVTNHVQPNDVDVDLPGDLVAGEPQLCLHGHPHSSSENFSECCISSVRKDRTDHFVRGFYCGGSVHDFIDLHCHCTGSGGWSRSLSAFVPTYYVLAIMDIGKLIRLLCLLSISKLSGPWREAVPPGFS